jgi:hypothetical protein
MQKPACKVQSLKIDFSSVEHQFWTTVLIFQHAISIFRIGNTQSKDLFQHSPEVMVDWINSVNEVSKFQEEKFLSWDFISLCDNIKFKKFLLDCLEPFYKHRMNISIIECIVSMVHAYIAQKNAVENREDECATIIIKERNVPWSVLFLVVNRRFSKFYLTPDVLKKISFHQIRSLFRKLPESCTFTSLIFNHLGIPSLIESTDGISLTTILSEYGLAYPIDCVFSSRNQKYKKFGELFLNIISENPVIPPEKFFHHAFNYLPNNSEKIAKLVEILKTQCTDVQLSEDNLKNIVKHFCLEHKLSDDSFEEIYKSSLSS